MPQKAPQFELQLPTNDSCLITTSDLRFIKWRPRGGAICWHPVFRPPGSAPPEPCSTVPSWNQLAISIWFSGVFWPRLHVFPRTIMKPKCHTLAGRASLARSRPQSACSSCPPLPNGLNMTEQHEGWLQTHFLLSEPIYYFGELVQRELRSNLCGGI